MLTLVLFSKHNIIAKSLQNFSANPAAVIFTFWRHLGEYRIILKGAKDEKFVVGNFKQIRPVRIGELESKPKINGWGLIF